jgi:hypothetical protein
MERGAFAKIIGKLLKKYTTIPSYELNKFLKTEPTDKKDFDEFLKKHDYEIYILDKEVNGQTELYCEIHDNFYFKVNRPTKLGTWRIV